MISRQNVTLLSSKVQYHWLRNRLHPITNALVCIPELQHTLFQLKQTGWYSNAMMYSQDPLMFPIPYEK